MKISDIGAAAGRATDKTFEAELAGFGLTSEQRNSLFPTPDDKAALKDLIQIVNGTADENEKKAKLIGGINKLAGAVIKVLGTAAKA